MRVYGGDTIVGRAEKHLVGYYDIEPDKWQTIELWIGLCRIGVLFNQSVTAQSTRGRMQTRTPIPVWKLVKSGSWTVEKWPPPAENNCWAMLMLLRARYGMRSRFWCGVCPSVPQPLKESEWSSCRDASDRFDSGEGFEDALRLALKTALCSPHFLFLEEKNGSRLDAYSLASRLSYFLWSSTPDRELLQLAGDDRLHDQNVLRQQVERLLRDPRSRAFKQNFTGQWLGCGISISQPDERLYPEFDELLKYQWLPRRKHFFRKFLIKSSVLNFIDSDFVMVNERLAAHYGIDGVQGR